MRVWIFKNVRGGVIAILSAAFILITSPNQVLAGSAGEYAALLDAIGKGIAAAAENLGNGVNRSLEAASQILNNAGDGVEDAQQSDQSGDTVHALSNMSGVVGNLTAAGRFKFSNPDYNAYVSAALTTAMSIRNDLLAQIVAQENCGDGKVDSGEQCDLGSQTSAVCPKGYLCLKDCSCGAIP